MKGQMIGPRTRDVPADKKFVSAEKKAGRTCEKRVPDQSKLGFDYIYSLLVNFLRWRRSPSPRALG